VHVVPERLRLRYTKTGRIRYTSQRDVARAWERALRRAKLPVAYSEGFSPRPLLSFSLALPTGCESQAEFTDIRFSSSSPVVSPFSVGDEWSQESLAIISKELGALLPEGLDVTASSALGGAEGSLQEEVTSCLWIMEVTGMSAAQGTERVEALLGAANVPIERERKGRQVTDDLRPSVLSLKSEGPGQRVGSIRLSAELATKPRGVRPAELLQGIDPTLRLVRASRQAQLIEFEGTSLEPLTEDGRLLGVTNPTTAKVGR